MVTYDTAAPMPYLKVGLSRRTALGGIGAGLLAAGLGGLPRGAAAQAGSNLPLVSGVFVGTVPELNAYLAVVAGAVAADGGPREVAAYLCDGVSLTAWFTGLAAGNLVGMSSDERRLELLLTPEATLGVVSSATGEPIAITAPAASGIAGLYDVSLEAEGTLSGSAVVGEATLAGRVVEGLDDHGLVAGIVTRPPRQRHAVVGFLPPAAEGELRFVVLPSGQLKGDKKGGGNGFMKSGSDF